MIVKSVSIDVQGQGKPFPHFFRATGYANADYTYTPPLRRMYDCLSSYAGHPLYMRLHNIFSLHGKGDYYVVNGVSDYGNPIINGSGGADIVVTYDDAGNLKYDWELVDRVYDIIVNHGMHPIVEAVYMPSVIRKSEQDYNMPVNNTVWETVVTAFVRHWVERYGVEEVLNWYFEICNEPEQYSNWNSDPSSFFALYDYFERAVHSVDSRFKVGGPAVQQWDDGHRLFEKFLAHCDSGVNYCSGDYGSRIDFISVHCKGGIPGQVGPSMDFMFNSLREYIAILKRFPRFADTEFFNDESDIVWDGNRGIAYKSWLNFRNTHYAPGFICKMIHTYCSVVQDELGVKLSIVDSDNCHLTWEKSFFSGNRSQFTPLAKAPCTDILRKPMFNAFQLLGRLGDERLPMDVEDSEFGLKYGVLATRTGRSYYAFMVWNFEDGLDSDVNERTIQLKADHLDENSVYDTLHFRIDADHSNAYGQWMSMGRPYPLSAQQISFLREHDGLELYEEPGTCTGRSSFEKSVELPMHAVSLVLLVKRPDHAAPSEGFVGQRPVCQIEQSVLDAPQVYISWKYSDRKDLVGYRLYRGLAGEPYTLMNTKPLAGSYYVDSAVEPKRTYSYVVSALYADGSESPRSLAGEITI